MAAEEAPEVLTGLALGEVLREQALDGIRNVGCRAAISNRPRRGLIQAERATDAKIVSIDEAIADLNLLAFNTDVGDPVLTATVGATGHVQLQVLIESRQAIFELFYQPTRESFGLGDGEFAEFRAAAGNRATSKARATDAKPNRIEFLRQRLGVDRGNIHYEQVLHVGSAEFAARKALRQFSGRLHLVCSNAAAQCNCSYVAQPMLFLGVDANVVAVNIIRSMFFDGRIEFEADAIVQFIQEPLGGPAMAQEEEFQASAFAMFA